MNTRKNKKVIIAISGGVDSSVSAALLERAGFEAAGVFMRFWAESSKGSLSGRWNRCCSLEAELRARRVAKKINIPFYVLNFEKEFKKKVVDYFLKEYKAGRTPNPCVVCNKEIKFGLLLKKMLAIGADYIATGHYAKIKRQILKIKSKNQKSKIIYRLYRSKDKNKDQSYFLWQLNQNQLRHIIFPVGNYTKREVRKLARKFDLPTAETLESQEICFVKTKINDFLKKHIITKAGKIIDTRGKIIGTHQGLAFYTIGQRKKIGLSGGPYYVVNKDLKRNYLIVTKNEKDLYQKDLIVGKVNWISGEIPKLPQKIEIKIRYRQKATPALIISKLNDTKYKIQFKTPQRAITPGQSAVFYKKNELLGGGIII
jgi:tRNA-specific 2-thiouridylase